MKPTRKTSLRKIQIQGKTYLWKTEHCHEQKAEHVNCIEKVTIYLDGYKKSPLYLLFRDEDNQLLQHNNKDEKWCIGYPDSGVIWRSTNSVKLDSKKAHTEINLNRPAVIATLIKYFITTEWHPTISKKPLIKENALLLIGHIEF